MVIPSDVAVVLVRHGETEWSRSGRHTSFTDVPLTEHGRDEARPLAARLADATFALVILQVSYFKWTGGKRIFKMTPLHHHFEEKEDGWSETQVTLRFWIVGLMFGLIGVAFALL